MLCKGRVSCCKELEQTLRAEVERVRRKDEEAGGSWMKLDEAVSAVVLDPLALHRWVTLVPLDPSDPAPREPIGP